MDWDNLRYFLAVAQTGSIRGASLKLCVNHSTVSRRIKIFEKKIGQQLFKRLQIGYVITPDGEEMYKLASHMEERINAMERRTLGQDNQLNGELRVTVPQVLATHLLMPVLSEFTAKHPVIDLDLMISPLELNLTNREADIAIRITNDPPENLIGKKIIRYTKSVYASQEYIAAHDFNGKNTVNWIGWNDISPNPWWVQETDFPEAPIYHKFNNESAQIEAAKAGMGMTMLPCFMGDAEQELRRVPHAGMLPSYEIWILTHPDLRSSARVQVFTKFVAEALEKKRDVLEGRL